jgi:glutamate-1-semialdehyde aminotransferase
MPLDLRKSLRRVSACRVPRGVLDRAHVGEVEWMPTFFQRGDGAHVWDIDGNRYVDMVLGKGVVTLGHGFAEVNAAAAAAAANGAQLPVCPASYAELADRLAELIPAAESSLFLKGGSDATVASIRLSRAFTGRDVIAFCGYHGWHDCFIPKRNSRAGTPKSTQVDMIDFAYDLELLERVVEERGHELAGILVTPEPELYDADFLVKVRALADRAGAVLTVDEVKCGMHLTIGGAHDYYGVRADLITLSKGLANGFPISAVCGRPEILDASALTHMFGTYFYGGPEIAACLKTLEIYQQRDVIGHQWRQANHLMDRLDEVLEDEKVPAWTLGPGPRYSLLFEDEAAETLFYKEATAHGALFYPVDNQTTSLAHDDAVSAEVIDACARALRVVRDQHYGNRRERPELISPRSLARYEVKRLSRGGLVTPEQVLRPRSQRWPQLKRAVLDAD